MPSFKFTDQEYLRGQQYRSADNLKARILLHERFSTNSYGWFRWVWDQFDLPAEANLLEIGCGPGSFWPAIANQVPEGWKIYLTDFSPGMIAAARKNLQGMKTFRSFNISDAQAIPFPTGHFDAVLANHMLYHVPDREKALREISRVLKPGGCLYAATNGQGHLSEIYDLVDRFSAGYREAMKSPFNLQNGAAQLAPWFASVSTRLYEDALVVTEAEPLVVYIRSMTTSADLTESQVAELRDHLTREIGETGAYRVAKSTGMFVARKGTGA